MKVLFDQGVPVPLRRILVDHEVVTAHEANLSRLANGDLLRYAEARFEILVTTDQSLRHQQNLSGLRLAILVLPTTSWPKIRRHSEKVAAAIRNLKQGEFREIEFDPEAP